MVNLHASFTFNDQDDKSAAPKRWKRSINRTGPSKDETAVSEGVFGQYCKKYVYKSTNCDKDRDYIHKYNL